jgi:menaquinone-dependent protoporphyrinogen oxidase
MRTLVTVASKHGGTEEIGQQIAATLRAAGHQVDCTVPEAVESVAGYDAVVVGSGLYMGRWMGTARDFVEANAEILRRMPVWLFASGPVTPVVDEGDTKDGDHLAELIGARGNRVFAGRLERNSLGFLERQIVKMIKSPWGDYRPWETIRAWATSIANDLNASPAHA